MYVHFSGKDASLKGNGKQNCQSIRVIKSVYNVMEAFLGVEPKLPNLFYRAVIQVFVHGCEEFFAQGLVTFLICLIFLVKQMYNLLFIRRCHIVVSESYDQINLLVSYLFLCGCCRSSLIDDHK